MRWIIGFQFFLAINIFFAFESRSAEVELVEAPNFGDIKIRFVSLSGDIVGGDHQRFLEALWRAKGDGALVVGLIGYSRGGVVSEAIKIGRTLRENMIAFWGPELSFDDEMWAEMGLHTTEARDEWRGAKVWRAIPSLVCYDYKSGRPKRYTTRDDENCICASACSLIAFGGSHSEAVLGLHRSFIPNASELSFTDMREILGASHQDIDRYLEEMKVPSDIVSVINSTKSTSLLFLEYKEKTPLLEEFILARCGDHPTNLMNASDDLSWLISYLSFLEKGSSQYSRALTEGAKDLNLKLGQLEKIIAVHEGRVKKFEECEALAELTAIADAQGLSVRR